MLPEPVLKQAAEEMLDWHGSGMSVMEMSHRGKQFIGIHAQAEADLRELLAIPKSYKVLFLQGGAAGQFAFVPMNLLRGKAGASYVNTGHWATRAIAEAKRVLQNHYRASPSANFTRRRAGQMGFVATRHTFRHVERTIVGGSSLDSEYATSRSCRCSSHRLREPLDLSLLLI